MIGECGERVELDKETLFLEKTEKSGLLAGAAYEDPVKTIRKDIVDKALKALPARSKTTKEVMMKRMKSVRTLYSLSDIEAAYMVYKWEYENLQYDCYHYNHDRDLIDFTEDGTYKSGVGVCNGFAYLYARLELKLTESSVTQKLVILSKELPLHLLIMLGMSFKSTETIIYSMPHGELVHAMEMPTSQN